MTGSKPSKTLIFCLTVIFFWFVSVSFSLALNKQDSSMNMLYLDWIDNRVNLAHDYYSYANGNWQKHHLIPPNEPFWDVNTELERKNEVVIYQFLVKLSNQKNPNGSIEQKIGDFFASGMDEKKINEEGITQLAPELQEIEGIKTKYDLQKMFTRFQLMGDGTPFGLVSSPDLFDSKKTIGSIVSGSLGLPDRDYYLKQTSPFQRIRGKYVEHIARMLMLSGIEKDRALKEARAILSIETDFAKASYSSTEAMDYKKTYHMMNRKNLNELSPAFNWDDYFKEMGHPEIQMLNVSEPHFIKVMNEEIKNRSLEEWKAYLRWHLLHTFAIYLPSVFANEDLSLDKAVSGITALSPRWLRIVRHENNLLGFAVGKYYVEKNFPPAYKAAVLKIVNSIRLTLRKDLMTLAWMSPSTRAAAIDKLDKMQVRVGYPDKWPDYSSLRIDRGSYIKNVIRASQFNVQQDLNKIGHPVDPKDWLTPPQSVNADYDPSTNSINFYAGTLQPPFFDPNALLAANYGSIGATIGHEMTHGFDSSGGQFDANGNMSAWWQAEDLQKFHQQIQCIIDQFSHYSVNKEHVQGNLVVDEAVADLGGVILAWRAFQAAEGYKQAPRVANMTPDQQFFLAFAHSWATNIRPERARQDLLSDQHPPAIFRVNGTLANVPAFQHAYSIPANGSFINKMPCTIW
jgi:putative endopeptidase